MTEPLSIEVLEARVKTLLPQEYQDNYQEMQPTPMRSAGLKFGADGKVAWNEIWGSFCDLAMAGGPPHKGMLLEPAPGIEIDAQRERYDEVVQEICRGIGLVTGMPADPAPARGWITVECYSETMAGWLVRAIAMENVAVSANGVMLAVPAGPGYRLDKEIKNVVTVLAKTTHYWLGHLPRVQQRQIASLFADLAEQWPLIQPAPPAADFPAQSYQAAMGRLAETIADATGLRQSGHRYLGWLGVECPTVRAAIWMMRAMVACNVLSRREGTVLFVPVNPTDDPDGHRVAATLVRVHALAAATGVL
ncbi:MAG TPA: hypothetical protein VIY56_16390 [Vicinamibacterales bacterium]